MLTTHFLPGSPAPQEEQILVTGSTGGWELRKGVWKKGGEQCTPIEMMSLKVPLEGGPVSWVQGKRIRESCLFEPFVFESGTPVQVNLVSTMHFVELNFSKKQHRGALYPTVCRKDEELQLPVAGSDHFIYLLSGEIKCSDRQNPQAYVLKPHDLLVVTRSQLKKEYLNLKVWGCSSQSRFLWGVLHLANHK